MWYEAEVPSTWIFLLWQVVHGDGCIATEHVSIDLRRLDGAVPELLLYETDVVLRRTI